MIIAIQCARSKKANAGCLRRADGREVKFVARPELAPADTRYAYAHPDEPSDTGSSWREELLRYNDEPTSNPLGLLPAWQLYRNDTYELLAEKVGIERLYILSAGWGLLSAAFLTPDYDITFSAQAALFTRRRKKDQYDDLQMLPSGTAEPVVILAGDDYIAQACRLTEAVAGDRYVFCNSKTAPMAPGCNLKRYETTMRTNWHYQCAKDLIAGKVSL